MSDSILVFRVVDWDQRYETRGTLKKSGPRHSVPALTDLGRVEMQRVLDAPGGFAALAIWHIVWNLAARSQRRGALVEGGVPLSVSELARVARCPEMVAEQALVLLCSPGICLLEQVSLAEALRPPEISPAPPRKPRKPPTLPLAECPYCHADLTACSHPIDHVQASNEPNGCADPMHRVGANASPQPIEPQVITRDIVPGPAAPERNFDPLPRRKRGRKAKNLARRRVSPETRGQVH